MIQILTGDALEQLKTLPDQSVNCFVTSPPYYNLRDYGVDGQIGLERAPEEYIQKLVEVFREARRVLRDDGTLWINIADSYAGSGKGRNTDGTYNKKSAKAKHKQGEHRGQFNSNDSGDNLQAERLNRHTVDACFCTSGGWVALTARDYMVETQSNARECA